MNHLNVFFLGGRGNVWVIFKNWLLFGRAFIFSPWYEYPEIFQYLIKILGCVLILLWVCLDWAYFCWNWKYCSKLIFKCVNSAVGPIFNKKNCWKVKFVGPWTVNGTHWCAFHGLFCCEQYMSWWKVYSKQVEKSKTTAGKKKEKRKETQKRKRRISWIQTLP